MFRRDIKLKELGILKKQYKAQSEKIEGLKGDIIKLKDTINNKNMKIKQMEEWSDGQHKEILRLKKMTNDNNTVIEKRYYHKNRRASCDNTDSGHFGIYLGGPM